MTAHRPVWTSHWLQAKTKCKWGRQQLCKSCRTCFKFYCMFYFTCDRAFRKVVKLNTHRRRRRDSTPLSSWVASTMCSLFNSQLVQDGFGRRIENWTCWEFIQSSWLQNWKLGHDCRRVSTHRTTQLDSICSVFNFSTKSVCSDSWVASASAVCIGLKEMSESFQHFSRHCTV